MKICLIIFFSLITSGVYSQKYIPGQGLTYPVENAVVDHDSTIYYLQTGNNISCQALGRSLRGVYNFKQFVKFTRHYSIDTLRKYLDAKFSESLRVYAAWALILRKADSLGYVLADVLTDNRSVYYSCGCLGNQKFTVKQFVYQLINGQVDRAVTDIPRKTLRFIDARYQIQPQKVAQPWKTDLYEYD